MKILFFLNKGSLHLKITIPFVAFATIPLTVILLSTNQSLLTIFSVLGFMVFFTTMTGLFITHSLSKPVHELQKGVKEIGLGNLDYTFRVHTNDELQDLTQELDKMRTRLKRIRSREENLSKLKSEFVSIVAHQLRTPLSALKWAISLFEESKTGMSAEQKDLIGKMTSSNERMIRLVNDLLDAARIEEGRFVYNPAETSFEKILDPVLDAVEQKAKQKDITLRAHKSKTKLPSMVIDQEAMSLALQNVIENAIRYTPPKGKVEIAAGLSDKNAVVVSVQDNGIGIPAEEKERIFSKFFRGTNAIRVETEGSGLGLFIVKNIIEAHGGTIWFESKEGVGTTFYFTIPTK